MRQHLLIIGFNYLSRSYLSHWYNKIPEKSKGKEEEFILNQFDSPSWQGKNDSENIPLGTLTSWRNKKRRVWDSLTALRPSSLWPLCSARAYLQQVAQKSKTVPHTGDEVFKSEPMEIVSLSKHFILILHSINYLKCTN